MAELRSEEGKSSPMGQFLTTRPRCFSGTQTWKLITKSTQRELEKRLGYTEKKVAHGGVEKDFSNEVEFQEK